MRKDHLRLITDTGKTLDLGWDYGIPYSIEPLNGIDVELQLAQGTTQTGRKVERQSVAGVSREIVAHFWREDGEQAAKVFLDSLPYFTRGTLYLGDKWFCRFVLSKTPYTVQIEPYPVLDFMVYCEKPYWYDLTLQRFAIGGYSPAFHFPVNFHTHRYGVKNSDTFVNALNPGSLPVPFTATLSCTSSVTDPRVVNMETGGYIGLSGVTLTSDDTVEFYTDTDDHLAVKRTRAGVEENLFAYLDEDSTLIQLAPGDNLLRLSAASGANALQVVVQFYPMVSGILPEVDDAD